MKFSEEYLIGSAKRAMSGEISQNVTAVLLQYKNEILKLHFYYAYTPTENEKDSEGVIAAEISSDLPGIRSIDLKSEIMPKTRLIQEEGYLQVYKKNK